MSLPWQMHLLMTTSVAALVTSAGGGGGDGTQWDFSSENNSGHLLTCGIF